MGLFDIFKKKERVNDSYKFEKDLKKWGQFIDEDKFYIKQCNLSRYSPKTFLNVLFKSIDKSKYERVEKVLNCKLPQELMDLYENYNGVMLFAQTFRIFGVGVESLQSPYSTLDIVNENITIQKKYPNWDPNFVNFGYQGSRYRFCYHRDDMKKIYVVDRQSMEIVHEFENLDKLMKYYVEKLSKYYNDNGYLINKTDEELKFPLGNIVEECI